MELLDTILMYASMWGPAIVSICGIAATVVIAIGKVVNALKSWQTEQQSSKEASDALHADMRNLITQNKNLQKYNQKLLEELTRIAGYDITLEDEVSEK